MALVSNLPTFTYVKWSNMIITYDSKMYKIQNGYTDKTYLYWDMTMPYQLLCTNEKKRGVGNLFLIAVNEKGIATELPNDLIQVTYDGINPDKIAEKIFGIYEKNEEFGNKFVTVEEDINGIRKSVGEVKEESGKLTEEVSKINQSVGEISAGVSKVEKEFNDSQATTELRESLNKSIIELNSSLGIFKSYLSDVSWVSKISAETKAEIEVHLSLVDSRKETVILYVDKVLAIVDEGGFTDKFNSLTSAKTKFVNAINNLKTLITSIVADNTFVPSEITMYIDSFGKANVAINELKNSCDDCIYLGVGGASSEEMARLSLKSDKISFQVSKVEETLRNSIDVESSQLQAQTSDVLKALSRFKDVLDDVFENGEVTESEKVVVNDSYASLEKEKGDMTNLYNKYYEDTFLSTSVKVALKVAYDAYNNKHIELKTKVDDVISDTFVNEAEMNQVSAIVTAYETMLNQLQRAIATSINDIQLNKNNKAIKDAKDEAMGKIGEVDEKVSNLDNTLNTTFKDNVIDEAERKAIAQNVITLESEKADVDKQYTHLYSNKYLNGDLKLEYKNSYDSFIAKYNALITVLNGILTMERLITEADRENMSVAYSELSTALGNFGVMSSKVLENVANKEAESIKLDLDSDISDVNSKVTNLSDTMNGTFKNNVIDEAERKTIKENLKNLTMEKNDIDSQYTQLYSNANLTGQLKVDFKTAYDGFISKYNSLISVVNNILGKTGLINDTDRLNLDKAYEALSAPLTTFITVANKVIEEIARKQSEAVKTALDKEITELGGAIAGLENDLNGAFKDDVISDTEKANIELSLKSLEREKIDIDKTYTTTYNNAKLVGVAKTNLKTSYDAFTLKYNSLVTVINGIISKVENVTDSDRLALNTALDEYKLSVGEFSTKYNLAIDSITTQGISDAKSSLSTEIGQVNVALGNLENTMNGVFKQSVLSDAEKLAIKQNLKSLETEKLDIDKRYSVIYANTNLIGTPKSDLKTAYDNYIVKYNSLVSVVNTIISKEGMLVESDQINLNNAFSAHNTALTNFSDKYSKAVDSITAKSIDDTKKALQSDITDVSKAVGGLETSMNGVFKQGVLSDSEKLSIKQNLQTLLNEKSNIDKQYATLYANEDLIDQPKVNLKSSYDDYIVKYNALVSVVNTIVNKTTIIDDTDRGNLNTAFNNHRTSLGVYSTRVNEAIDAIVNKKALDAETTVKKYTDAKIEIVNNEIKSKVSQTEYDGNNKVVNQKISELKQSVDGWNYNITATGGDNEIANSNFEAGGYRWHDNNGAYVNYNVTYLNPNYGKMISIKSLDNQIRGIFQPFKTIPNQKYTVSFYAEADSIKSLETNIGVEGVHVITLKDEPGFKRWSFEFTATKTEHVFIAYVMQAGMFYLGRVMVNQGILQEYSPRKNEVYSTDVKIDIDGISVDSINAGLGTKINPNGLEVFDKNKGYAILTAKNGDVIARGGNFKVSHPQNGDIVLWGRDVVINNGRALVGTGNVSEIGTNKLFINYQNDFFKGVHIGGQVSMDTIPTVAGYGVMLDKGFNWSETGYQILSSGLILQWGVFGGFGDQSTQIWFPTTFPHACHYFGTEYDGDPDCVWRHWVFNVNNSGGMIRTLFHEGAGRDRSRLIKWFAIGY